MRAIHRDEGGQAIVLVTLVMLTLLFFVGLAIDSGQLFNGRRTAQEAADAAAFAGAIVLYQGGTVAQAEAAALADAQINGFVPGALTTITINQPPGSGEYQGRSGYVEVIIETQITTSLVPAQAQLNFVRVRGVAGTEVIGSRYAVMSLDQTCTSSTLKVGSNGQLAVNGGGILSNSCHSNKAADNASNLGAAGVTLESGYYSDIIGGVSSGGSWPSVRTGRPVQPDPFAGAPKPSTEGVPSRGTPQCAPTVNQPGVYTGSASSNCEYIWAPGVFILKGSGINLAGSSAGACTGPGCSVATADGGVFFFVTSSSYPSTTSGPSNTCAATTFKVAGGVNTTISAPTSGTYQGLLVWVDSICGNTSIAVGGGGSVTTSGSIYAPTGTVNGNGTGSAVTLSHVIAKRVDVQNAHFTMNYNDGDTYHPPIPALVE